MPGTRLRLTVLRSVRQVVVKVGTNSLTDERGHLDLAYLNSLARQIAALVQRGLHVVLVSSGAVGAGMAELNLPGRPKSLPLLQATAAVGQGQLMRRFYDAFAACGVKVAQILITRGDFEDRRRFLNIRNTITALQRYHVVPIINENDTVAVDELPGGVRGKFGDNDIIAAHVTNMLRAGLLVILSVVDGVLKAGQVLDVLEDGQPKDRKSALGPVAAGVAGLADGTRSRLGTGGMDTKLTAAFMVSRAGELVIIANARTPDVLPRLLAGAKLGTLIVPATRKMKSRRRWIAHTAATAGSVVVDDGAAKALLEGGKSLLPSGITAVAGEFEKGANIAILTAGGIQIARGLTNYSSDEIRRIKGLKSSQIAKLLGEKPYDEIVHRNNMTTG